MNKLTFATLCLLLFLVKIDADDSQTSVAYKKSEYPKGAIFFESFDEDWKNRWVSSENEKYSRGKWEVTTSEEPEGLVGDKALTIPVAARHYAISAAFDNPADTTDKDLIIQYEVRLQHGLDCGGAYLKLLTHPFDPASFVDQTPYTIMFGPDKCGSDSKVHFIFRHQNPISKEYEEKHMTNRPQIINNLISHLYTLVIRANNTFEVYIDQKLARQGSFFEDFEPSVLPPKEIDDPTDQKPANWVDLAQIPDPTATKPAYWDDQPAEIPDPDASIPVDWDQDQDGEWEAPLIDNPDYQGEWEAPLIANPEYKGEWKPRQIANPNYFDKFTGLDKMGGIGFELWTMTDAIQFDNILVCNSKELADKVAESWKLKNLIQEKYVTELQAEAAQAQAASFNYKPYVDMFIAFAGQNPYIVLATGALGVIIPIVICLLVPHSADPVVEKKEEKKEETKKEENEDKKEDVTEETEVKEEEKKSSAVKRRVRKEDD